MRTPVRSHVVFLARLCPDLNPGFKPLRQSSMLIVHHLNNSRSQRVLWMLEELGVDYEIKRYQRDANTMLAPPELRAVHPLGKSPVITDDGQTIAESGAIIEYLNERYGQGRFSPPHGTTPERIRYNYWMHYAEGSAMPPLLLKLVALRIASAPMPFFVKPIARRIAQTMQDSFIDPQLKLHFGFFDSSLSMKPKCSFNCGSMKLSCMVCAIRRAIGLTKNGMGALAMRSATSLSKSGGMAEPSA